VGASCELSALTLTVGRSPGPTDTNAAVALLRRAREAGITTFDTVESPDPDLGEALLARAFPDGDPNIVVLAHGRPPRAPTPGARAPSVQSPVTALADSGPRRGHAAAPQRLRHVYELEIAEISGSTGSAPGTQPGEVEVLRCRSVDDLDRAALLPGPRLLSGSFSLLDRSLGETSTRRLEPGSYSWIVRDPFAAGRLDASRFAAGSTAIPAAAPRTVRELEAEFEPVARLGFLARPRQRTLAQAALHFVLGHPWVVSACIPAPAPERWTEIVGFATSPPLDDQDKVRLGLASGHARPRAEGAGGPR